MVQYYQKIILPSRPQPDTILAIFLLKKFGKEKYPGIENVSLEVRNILPEKETPNSLAQKGYILIDIGGGKFDHHQKGKTASQLVAEDLGINNKSSLAKLLNYVERDDKYGLGTISSDPIDKAFGLSGLITSLNKVLPKNPQKVVNLILPIIYAHYQEEKKRTEDLPKEFETKLKKGEAEVFEAKQEKKKLKVIILESDSSSISGWLKSSIGLKADVIAQKTSTGHINILTRPLKRVDLRWLTAFIRNEEAVLGNKKLKLLTSDLMKPGRIPEIPQWYYDRATNSILNGGVNPKGTSPTIIPLERIKELIKQGLTQSLSPNKKQKVLNEPKVHQYFLEIRLPIEEAKEIREMLGAPPAGIKFHQPENYHLTLLYLGDYNAEEIPEILQKIQSGLRRIKPFLIIIDRKSFKDGLVPGYSAKAFYFPIKEKEDGDALKGIHQTLKKAVPRYQAQEFFPHLTVASAMPQIEEAVFKKTKIILTNSKEDDIIKTKEKVEFEVDKIRLTQIIKTPSGQITYRAKHYFPLR